MDNAFSSLRHHSLHSLLTCVIFVIIGKLIGRLFVCYRSGESDFIQLLECCVVGLERDVVKEGERDHTLKVYFERIYAKESDDNCYYEFHAVAYPFGLLG